MNTKKIISALFGVIFTINAFAQQDPMYSQYWLNAGILNPAQVGADGLTTLNVTGRYQWVNLEGAPKTNSISFGGMPVDNLGIGGSYVYDEIGPVRTNTLNADVAYHLRVSKKWTATLGTRISAMNTQLLLGNLSTTKPGDPAFSQNLNSGIKPNVGFGILIHNDRFYFGFAQPRAIEYDLSTSAFMNTKIVTHNFIYTGYNFTVNDDVELRPSILLKEVNYAPLHFLFSRF
ncbi:MAG: PorP/SprF family type IX secretion system membrane protein [Bacteroidia bacterium]